MFKKLLTTTALVVFLLGISTTASFAAPLPGAIFTTNSGCSGVNLNIYLSKGAVYLDGGPHNGGATLPNGSYYVQVTDPSGATLLGTSLGSGDETPVHVTDGSFDSCYQLSNILIKASNSTPGYDTTGNPGGEYKVWVSTVSTFDNDSTKTDNFKVKENAPELIHLTVIKHVDNGNGGTNSASDFTINVAEGETIEGLFPGSEDGTTIIIDPGSYLVTETGPSGYQETDSLDCSGIAEVGGNYTCTITNDDIAPSLTLNKIVINDNGGKALESAWTLTADGGLAGTLSGPGATGDTDVVSGPSFKAGTYELSESGPSGYAASDWTCIKNNGQPVSGSSIILGIGDTATCAITNDDIPGRIEIIKNAIGGDGIFNFTVGGPTPSSPIITTSNGTGNTGLTTANAGTYSVTEGTQTGWDLTGAVCDNGTPVSFNVPLDTTVTCTFTNTKRGTITVIKKTDPVNDPTQFGFTTTGTGYNAFNLTGHGGSNTNTQLLVPGNYSVTESTSSWRFVSLVCTSDQGSTFQITGSTATISLGAGGNVACTYTNSNPRMTGGGSVLAGSIKVTHGFELHCSPAALPNNLEVNWGSKPENNFHLTKLISATCIDDPNIDSGHPRAPFDTYIGAGLGTLNNKSGATATWTFTDAGEPGKNDTVVLIIKDKNGNVVLNITTPTKLTVGNQQAH